MVVDVFIQLLDTTPSGELAVSLVHTLSKLFPRRPLFGTSNAVSILASIRGRFNAFGLEFQQCAMKFTRSLMLVDPTPWFAPEFQLLCEVALSSDANGARLVTAHIKELATITQYASSVCKPTVIHALLDLVDHAHKQQPKDGSSDSWTMLVQDALATLTVLLTTSPTCGQDIHFYGMECFFRLLRDPRVQAQTRGIVENAVKWTNTPTQLFEGLVTMLHWSASHKNDTGPEPTILEKLRTGNSNMCDDVIHCRWTLDGHSYIDASSDTINKAKSPDVQLGSPTKKRNLLAADTCLVILQLLKNIMCSNPATKNTFVEVSGVDALFGIVITAGATPSAHSDADRRIDCCIAALGLLASAASGEHAITYSASHFQNVSASSGVMDATNPVCSRVALVLLKVTMGLNWSPKHTAAYCQLDDAVVIQHLQSLVSLLDLGDVAGEAMDQSVPAILTHPSLVRIVMELVTSKSSSGEKCDDLALAVLRDVLSITASCQENIQIMCEAGILGSVLAVFHDYFLEEANVLHETVMRLFVTLGRYAMSGTEVRQITDLLNTEHCPATVVTAINEVVGQPVAQPVAQPRHYIDFASRISSPGQQAISTGGSMRFQMPSLSWPANNGLTVSFWMSFDKDLGASAKAGLTLFKLRAARDGDELDDVGITASLDRSTGYITIHLGCNRQSGVIHTLSEMTCFKFQPNSWYHVVVTHTPMPARLLRKAEAELRLYVNGVNWGKAMVPAFGGVRHLPVECEIGSTQDMVPVKWYLGVFFVLRQSILPAEAYLLYAMGPNLIGFHGGLQDSIYAECLSSEMIQNLGGYKSAFDLVVNGKTIADLSRKLVCYFRPKDCRIFHEIGSNFQPAASAASAAPPTSELPRRDNLPGAFDSHNSEEHSPSGASAPPQSSPGQNTDAAPRIASQKPNTAALCPCTNMVMRWPARMCHRRGLQEAIHELGGMHVLLYKLATAGPTETDQLGILRLIFLLLRFSPENSRSMRDNEGYVMLNTFLTSERCILGANTVSVLLHACVKDTQSSAGIQLSRDAVVCNTELLKQVLLDWHVFAKAPLNLWIAVYNALVLLVDPETNDHAAYNAMQFRRIGTIQKLLFTCEVEKRTFPGKIVLAILRLVNFLMNATDSSDKQMLADMAALMNFLVASHTYRSFRARQTGVYSASPAGPKVQGSPGSVRMSPSIQSNPLKRSLSPRFLFAADQESVPEERLAVTRIRPLSPGGGGAAVAKATERPAPVRTTPPSDKLPTQTHPRLTHSRIPDSPSKSWLSQMSAQPTDDEYTLDGAFLNWIVEANTQDTDEMSIRTGIFRLLQGQLFSCPTSAFVHFQEIFSVKSLLALADNESEVIRVTTMRIIDYLLRIRGPFSGQFLSNNGFKVLTNQLQQHRPTEELFVATCNIYTGQAAKASRFCDSAAATNDTAGSNAIYFVVPLDLRSRERAVYSGQPECVQVLFSLLKQSISSPSLCIGIFVALRSIFMTRKDLRGSMMAHDIVQTICDVLVGAESTGDPIEVEVDETGHPVAKETVITSTDSPFNPGEQEVILAHAASFLNDITLYVCHIIKQEKGEGSGTRMIEDIVDYLGHWGLHPNTAATMQRAVLQTALKQLFSSIDSSSQFWKLWGSKPKNQVVHPAQIICCMAIDSIIYTSTEVTELHPPSAAEDENGDLPPARQASEGSNTDHTAFVCNTFNTIKILILHDMAMWSDEMAVGTNLIYQFGRYLIHILSHVKSSRVLAFVICQLASTTRLYDVVARQLPVCRELLLMLSTCHMRLKHAEDEVSVLICENLVAGATHILKTQDSVRPYVAKANLKGGGGYDALITFSDAMPAKQRPWSQFYDEKHLVKLKERGSRKRISTQRQKETVLKVGLSALDVTSSTIEMQDKHKKHALQQLQMVIEKKARIQKRWRQLCDQVRQPRAVWSKPSSGTVWMLDPCEGPLRMRKRLCQAQLPRSSAAMSRSPAKDASIATSVLPTEPELVMPPLADDDDPLVSSEFEFEGVTPLSKSPEVNDSAAELVDLTQSLVAAVQEWLSQHLYPKLHECADPYEICRVVLRDWRAGNAPTVPEAALPTMEHICQMKKNGTLAQVLPEGTGAIGEPLSYLTKQDEASENDMSAGLLPGERLVDVVGCRIVTPFNIKAGELLLGAHAFYFKEDPTRQIRGQSRAQPASVIALGSISGDPGQLPCWSNRDIREVHERRYLLQQNALEIFLTDGTTLFFAFDTRKVRDQVRQTILSLDLPNYVDYSNTVNGSLTRDSITAQWVKGSMSNFEYLMHVNKLAGRSFNDLTQYPVMPYVLQDYESDELDLNNPGVYRDLTKPMGAQEPKRLEKFVTRYSDLVDLGEVPYHYGSHYSSVGAVLHFLVRLEPFTQLFLELQGGKFDFADRTFCSVKQAWDLSSKISTSDVKEMIPEMFFLPETLLNLNHCPFGTKQDGQVVDNVWLPPWAENSTRTFIYKHRQALESKHVSKQLNGWIDLIFGSKQTGDAAEAATNLFLPASYEGNINIDSIEDPVEREAQWAIVRSFGQTPKQLLLRPHVARDPRAVEPMKQFIHTRRGKPPEIIWTKTLPDAVHSLSVSPDGVIAAGPRHQVVPNLGLLIMWGAWDDALRVCILETGKEVVSMQELHDDSPVCVVAPSGRGLVASGGDTGLVSVYRIRVGRKDGRKEILISRVATLSGHSKAVATIAMSISFSVILSGSTDGTVVIWDLNQYSYVRSLAVHEGPITCLSVSDSTGDIASVCRCRRSPGVASRLHLWSINATLVATGDTDIEITSLLMSSMTDGFNPNIVVTGMEDGSVRIWDMLDLQPLTLLGDPRFISPVTALHLTDDGASLIVGYEDGNINCWHKPSARTERKLLANTLANTVGWVASGVRNKDRTLSAN